MDVAIGMIAVAEAKLVGAAATIAVGGLVRSRTAHGENFHGADFGVLDFIEKFS